MDKLANMILHTLTLIISVFLCFISFSEWYIVKIEERTTDYPFGKEGPIPYYYKTAELYSTVNLIWGISFLSILIFSIWIITIKKKKWTYLSFGLTIILLLGLVLQG